MPPMPFKVFISNKWGAEMKKITMIIACTAVALGGAHAELFTFDLANKQGASWDDVASGVYTNVGSGEFSLAATMYAYLNGSFSSGSTLNSTAAPAFGINATGSGDDTAYFDTNNGQEAVWIAFDRDVTVKSIVVASFAAGNVETGAYQVASGSLVNFTASGTYNIDTVLTQGSFFKVTAIDEGGGNGWSLTSFAVEAIPEPATLAMLGFGGLVTLVVRRMSRA